MCRNPYFIHIVHIKHIKHLRGENIQLQGRYWLILVFNGSNSCRESWHRVEFPVLLTTVCKHLGTEETRCWTFGR